MYEKIKQFKLNFRTRFRKIKSSHYKYSAHLYHIFLNFQLGPLWKPNHHFFHSGPMTALSAVSQSRCCLLVRGFCELIISHRRNRVAKIRTTIRVCGSEIDDSWRGLSGGRCRVDYVCEKWVLLAFFARNSPIVVPGFCFGLWVWWEK